MAPSAAIAYTLPTLQLVCNLVITDTPVWNDNNNNNNNNNDNNNNDNPGPIVDESTSVIPSGNSPNGYVAYPDIGAAYKIYNESLTWKEAREKCLSEGARLAVTDTYIKFEHLMSQVPLVNAIHVGIHRMYDDTEWVSGTTGSSFTTLPWAAGYPNGVYDCLLAGYNPRGLRNLACSTKAIAVCELPIQMKSNEKGNLPAGIAVN